MVNSKLLGICIGVGIFLGLVGFTISVGSMEGIFFRTQSGDTKYFTLGGYLKFYTVPFQINKPEYPVYWGLSPDPLKLTLKERLNNMSMNWILWVAAGSVLGLIAYKLLVGKQEK
jgi:hypothetical protein